MPDDTNLGDTIRKIKAQIIALGEIQALLLADFAQRTLQPIQTLREISNEMSMKLSEKHSESIAENESIGDIQQELDKIFAAARNRLE